MSKDKTVIEGIDDATQIKIYLDRNGVLSEVKDPDKPSWRVLGDPSQDTHVLSDKLPLEYENYNWDLTKYWDDGVGIGGLKKLGDGRARDVAPNDPDNAKHRNTISFTSKKLVKLDCGYWGAYKRWREYATKADGKRYKEWDEQHKQREFGLIDDRHVFLCNFRNDVTDNSAVTDVEKALIKTGAHRAARLSFEARRRGFQIDFVQYAEATFAADQLPLNKLYVLFPDLHVPECWSDLRREEERLGGRRATIDQLRARMKLQTALRQCQRPTGLGYGNPLGKRSVAKLQQYIEKVEAAMRQEPAPPTELDWDNRLTTPQTRWWRTSDGACGKIGVKNKGKKFDFTFLQFAAEKATVDREHRLESTWFYARGFEWWKNTRDFDLEKPFDPKKDRNFWQRGEGGDAAGAIDMMNFLKALRATHEAMQDPHNAIERAGPTGSGQLRGEVVIYQMGDMYELWLNNEFLYLDFKDRVDHGSKMVAWALRAVGGGLKWEAYQYRKGLGFRQPPNQPTSRWYSFNRWQKKDMVHRYTVWSDALLSEKRAAAPGVTAANAADLLGAAGISGSSPAVDILRRKRLLLKERVDNIERSALPFPMKDWTSTWNGAGHKGGKQRTTDPRLLGQSKLNANANPISGEHWVSEIMASHAANLIEFNPGLFKANARQAANLRDVTSTPVVAWPPPEDQEAAYRFPVPDTANLVAPDWQPNWQAINPTGYLRTNRRGEIEVCWNLMVLDMLHSFPVFESIYGNHDGYRADPILNTMIPARAKSKPWISTPGIWAEHAHRWDAFNMDGCAMGAAVTNLTYYFFKDLCSMEAGKKAGWMGLQEQMNFIPGAAVWFLLVNFGAANDWFDKVLKASYVAGVHGTGRTGLHPFGIYVNGHTHSARLCQMSFKLLASSKVAAVAGKVGDLF